MMNQPSLFSHILSREPDLWHILDRLRPPMHLLLREAIEQPSLSGGEARFVRFIEAWACGQGLMTECAEADEARLANYPQATMPHLPWRDVPSCCFASPAAPADAGSFFNAHSDVVPAGDPRDWRYPPWSGAEVEGRIYGRGAVDDKGPLVSALWAMLALREWIPQEQRGEVLLELVPGEEDCVGLGTLASLVHGVTADGVIVLEPTAGQPCCASRAGCRFVIQASGRAVHGTVKWLGADAIAIMRRVLEALETLEARWNERDADPRFAAYPIARPITVDRVAGGQTPGMIADRCQCEGYLELLPGDAIASWQERFQEELLAEVQPFLSQSGGGLTIAFGEEYDGHATPSEHPFCRLAAEVEARYREGAGVEMRNAECGMRNKNQALDLTGFNSGCEAGLRARIEGVPTLVWGPGSLAQAHAADESIDFGEVERVAAMFTEFAAGWSDSGGVFSKWH